MRGFKRVQVNGVRALIRHDAWMGWTVQHVMDGRACSGSGNSLAEIRRGLHAVTSPEGRARLRRDLPPHT